MLDKETLKNFFRAGARPSEAEFAELIDSCVNRIDDGFNKSAPLGLNISSEGESRALVSFSMDSDPCAIHWSISYDADGAQLLIKHGAPYGDGHVLALSPGGGVGIGADAPERGVRVGGAVQASGHLGEPAEEILGAKGGKQVVIPANGKWQDLTNDLSGCQAFEVMAGVGRPKSRHWALLRAIAMNAQNPRHPIGWIARRRKRIKSQNAWYSSRTHRLQLRWRGSGIAYRLQIRTCCDYSAEELKIRCFLRKLWFDADMSECQPAEPASGSSA